ncbi:hypothetical protein LOD99_1402 [Oopsacas minuta]|uniref:Uncharacterized protein n=1 Tax=Oopsacas minuta TaxID=111878 RepID=A0AAV7K5M8_9METZ|nr:hypothetical protein LOD99_1402 [Oopsacas minuta]
MAQRGKLDLSHGFMKEITKNQVDRSRYHDERTKTLQLKKLHYDSYQSKAKSFGEDAGEDQEPHEVEISIETSPGCFFTISVSKNRNSLDLANEIAEKSNLKEEFIPALDLLLQQKMKCP